MILIQRFYIFIITTKQQRTKYHNVFLTFRVLWFSWQTCVCVFIKKIINYQWVSLCHGYESKTSFDCSLLNIVMWVEMNNLWFRWASWKTVHYRVEFQNEGYKIWKVLYVHMAVRDNNQRRVLFIVFFEYKESLENYAAKCQSCKYLYTDTRETTILLTQ